MSQAAAKVSLFVSGEDDYLVNDTICDVCAKAEGGTAMSNRALLALFKRIAGSWESLCILATTSQDLDTRANDCAAILRCMYDAYLQAAYIATDPEVLGKLYIEFEPIERRKQANAVVRQDNKLAQTIATSPMRPAGEKRNQEEYEQVKGNYSKSKGPGTRLHWYPQANLGKLAEQIEKGANYEWFIARYNSAIHSGPWATLQSSSPKLPMLIKNLAAMIVFGAARLVVDNGQLQVSKESNDLIRAYDDVDFLNM